MNSKGLQLNKVLTVMIYLFLMICAIISLLPLFWMFTTAFKEGSAVISMPPQWIPYPASIEHFRKLFSISSVFRWFFNSVLVASIITISNLFFCSMAAYPLARKQFVGRDFIFWLIISMMMIPGQITLVPLFLMVSKLGFLNKYMGLILPSMVTPFGIFLLKQFMQTLPKEIEDAAIIDGCGEFAIYSRIMLPLTKPALAVLAIFIFTGNWNTLVWPLIVTNSELMRTLPVGLASLRQEQMVDYGLLMAGAAFMATPMIIAFLRFQKYFTRGLTVGAIKG
jgi:multiple sugar transport system permease protein